MIECKDFIDGIFFASCRKIANKNQIKAYVIGGWVRDQFLKRSSKDVDIVVEGDGISFARDVAALLNPNIHVNYFKNFGTAQFVFKGVAYEFVGARKESYQRDSRKPLVENGSIEEDVARRDFTINALAISLNDENYGELVDLYGGMDDLDKKRIVTPLNPDITYSDDPLRMLRAVRFASQLGFDIDSVSFQSIARNAKRLEIISKERIHTELNKILLSPKPSYGLELLYQSGLMAYILPEMILLHGVEEYKGKGHKDNFYHTLQVLDNVARESDNLWLLWAALLHDIAKPQTKSYSETNGWSFHGHEVLGSKMVIKIFKNLKLPLDKQMEYVRKLVFLHLRPISLTKEEITDSAVRRLIFEAGDDLEDLLILCQADITSKNEVKVKRYLQNLENLKAKIHEVEARDQIRNFQPPISGELIMKTFGLSPCRIIGDIKNQIKEAILDGEIPNNYEAAYQLMMDISKQFDLNKVHD